MISIQFHTFPNYLAVLERSLLVHLLSIGYLWVITKPSETIYLLKRHRCVPTSADMTPDYATTQWLSDAPLIRTLVTHVAHPLVSKLTTVQIELVCCGDMWYNKGAP